MRKIQSLSLLLFILLTSAVCFSGCQKQSQPSSQPSTSDQSAWTEGTSTDGEYITVRKKIDDDTVTSTVVGPKGVSIGIVHIQEGTYENIFVPYEGEFIRDKKSIYFMGVESNAVQNLENFSKSIMEFGMGIPAEMAFVSFQAALEYVFKIA